MARRELSEINAGSMADIAFLLLVFFLVVTTMSTDSGLKRLLPPPVVDETEPPEFIGRNVYEVFVNFNNALLVENEYMNIKDLREGAKKFLLSNGDNVLRTRTAPIDDFPIRRVQGSLDSVRSVVSSFEGEIKRLEKDLEKIDINKLDELKAAEDKIKSKKTLRDKALAVQYAFEYFGNYAPLPASAMISVKNDNSTNYETYVLVNNELEGALNDLRDELSNAKFGVSYNLLNQEDDEDKKKILAIREVYPQRISEAEPEDVNGFMSN